MGLRSLRLSVLAVFVAVVAAACIGFEDDFGPPDEQVVVDFRSVAVGSFHACGLDEFGLAYCWGGNGQSQLGVADDFDRLVPTPVAQGTEVFTELFLGGVHSCALNSSAKLLCWGSNLTGQLGIGTTVGEQGNPTAVTGDFSFLSVGAGDNHTCGVTRGRVAYCWGLEAEGRLGNGGTDALMVWNDPQLVVGDHAFGQITAGASHSCAITLLFEAYCWGLGGRGQLGTGAHDSEAEPTLVLGGLSFEQIDGGAEHTCAVTTEGDAYCWGLGESGQLGNGGTADVAEPTAVSGGLKFQMVSAGGGHTCGLTTTGDVYCWGRNTVGQLGDGTADNRNVPTPIFSNAKFQWVEAGGGQDDTATCAITTTNLVMCWGFGRFGQVGDGTGQDVLIPTLVANQLSGGTQRP